MEQDEARQKFRRSAKGTTCTHCRQLKLKCDSASVYPESCSRCKKVGQRCNVDPSFRRRGNREYTESLEQEVRRLRRLQGEQANSSGASPNDCSTVQSSGSTGSVGGDTLEDVRLSSAVVVTLIDIYFTTYHPYFPILPSQHDFMAEHDSNRLLLWTVLAIASQGREDMPDIYTSLVEPVRRLASDLYAPQSRSLKTMQALLLLCVWPFPHQQSINDPSMMYCSLATRIGYQLGLHRPLHRSDFEELATGRVSTAVEKQTWYGCFIVNQSLALRFGMPTAGTPGNAIVSALSSIDPSIPKSLLLGLHIAHLAYVWVNLLGDDDSASDGQHPCPSHMIAAFDGQLAVIERTFSDYTWPRSLRIELEGVRLMVYSFAIARRQPQDTPGAPFLSSATTEMLEAKALSATIEVATEARKELPSLKYWPAFPRFHVLFATCIGVHMAGRASDETLRKPLLDTCDNNAELLLGWSVYPRDSYARYAKHLSISIRRTRSHGQQGLLSAEDGTGRPPVRSRMAANCGYQLIWNAKHGKEPAQQLPTDHTVATRSQVTMPYDIAGPGDARVADVAQLQQAGQGPLHNDGMLWQDWSEADFLDIALDFSSMLDGPGQPWSQGLSL